MCSISYMWWRTSSSNAVCGCFHPFLLSPQGLSLLSPQAAPHCICDALLSLHAAVTAGMRQTQKRLVAHIKSIAHMNDRN